MFFMDAFRSPAKMHLYTGANIGGEYTPIYGSIFVPDQKTAGERLIKKEVFYICCITGNVFIIDA